MTKRRYNPDASREAILNAAERLFAEQGFGDTSTGTIAQAAGVSQSQIHYHFDSKRRLWDEVFNRRFAEYYAVQSGTLEKTGVGGMDRIAESIRAYFTFFQANPRFVKLLGRAQLDGGAEGMKSMSSDLVARGTEVIAQCQASGELRSDVPAAFILTGFLSLVTHYFESREAFFTGSPEDRKRTDEAYLEFILRIYRKGIAP
ncbi:MAG: TetR/AcrR family transcriptional regulator [Holophaga sp.]|nr:TetR/AcrR family transcriptional regulator [Holophaga sp.]